MKQLRSIAIALGVCLGAWLLSAQSQNDALRRNFQNPPDSAKPRVWWHWMNGNISKDGIKLDLEWMKRVGIGGFQNFDAALATPQIVEKRLVYMTPEWKDAFKYAATLADQLGLEMAIAGSPGWSESGGPWVPPAQAMKKVVWSETRVEGGKPFTGTLPKPPSTTGPFANIPRAGSTAEYYADSLVIAYREPDCEVSMRSLRPKVTSSGGQFDVAALTDGDLMKTTDLPAAAIGQKAWLQFEFDQPEPVRAVTLVLQGVPRRPVSTQELESSGDGRQFKVVAAIPGGRSPENTVAFPVVTAKYFRLTFQTLGPVPGEPRAPTSHHIAELVLHTGARVNHFEEKAAFATAPDLSTVATPEVSAQDAIRKSDVVNLTGKMQPDGTLAWTPPAGHWNILRMGYSLTGARNSPASPEATGLEVDKLNRGFVKAYLENYLDQYKNTVGPLMGKRGLQYVITDSWEAGVQNWTDDMVAEFTRRRGYDPRPWLPVLTGRVVESAESSDRFLWDFRRTISDLTTESHYEQITASVHARGMGRYSESHESGRAFIGDGMEVKRSADVPMSAMWTQAPGTYREQYGYDADIRESASVAHIYGQNLVAAESLTAGSYPWAYSPETLKPTADKELAMGLNRFVIHTSVHQPVSDKVPGLGLGKYGQWFTRHETWSGMAKPWVTYLTRSSYMLQQGHFVADVLYFYGEDSNLTAIFGSSAPDIPAGYNFDYVNADALVHELAVKEGRIVTRSGMSYRILALSPRSRQMSLPVLRKIQELVQAGAVVVGEKPVESPSLSDDQAAFKTLAEQIWSKSTVHAGQTIAAALAALQVQPDFDYVKPGDDAGVLFVHRKLPDGEVYWIDNRNGHAMATDATFRVQGKAAEFWHSDTGQVAPGGYKIENGRTVVPLNLEPYEAVFVVFRQPAAQPSRTAPQPAISPLSTVEGAWEVSFQAERGAPAKITLDSLSSWSANADPGVKYFSGTAIYRKTIDAPAEWFHGGGQLWLDLGDVKNLAEVTVNGTSLGVVWKPPFRVDLGSALKPGRNQVEIQVVNLWVNRLIGDQQPDTAKKYTYTTQAFYQADSALLPSGLLGPVEVVRLTLR